jgi:hypothetical protein
MIAETSLTNLENYKETLSENSNEILETYTVIVIEYLQYMLHYNSNREKNHTKFLFLRGLDTISHIFLQTLYYTKNLRLAKHHSQKSIYDYLEFVGQISEDKHVFLQLTSQDAVIYVYKKTIYDLIKNTTIGSDTGFIHTMDRLEITIQVYKNALSDNSSIISSLQHIHSFEKLCKKINKTKLTQEDISEFDKLCCAYITQKP